MSTSSNKRPAAAPPSAQEEDGESCTVCMSRPRTVRNQPCGHAMCCELCTVKGIDAARCQYRCPNVGRCEVTRLELVAYRDSGGEPRLAKMPTFKPGAEPDARAFESLHDFLLAMRDNSSAEVAEAAGSAVERWGQAGGAGGASASLTLMVVTVPDNVHAGERMVVMTPSGEQFMVVVPEGSGPGLQFQIAVPRRS